MMFAQASPPPPLPSVRRVITGHTPNGKSTIIRNAVQPPRFWALGSINTMRDIYPTDESPAVIDTEVSLGEWVDEISKDRVHISANGSVFRSFNFTPGAVGGSIVIELDDGERAILNEGDAIVQRGTIRTWRNESSAWARIFFVVLGACPVKVEGED